MCELLEPCGTVSGACLTINGCQVGQGAGMSCYSISGGIHGYSRIFLLGHAQTGANPERVCCYSQTDECANVNKRNKL